MIKEGTDISTLPEGHCVISAQTTCEKPSVKTVIVRASDCKCKICGQQADVFGMLIPGILGKPYCFSCAAKVEDEMREKISII